MACRELLLHKGPKAGSLLFDSSGGGSPQPRPPPGPPLPLSHFLHDTGARSKEPPPPRPSGYLPLSLSVLLCLLIRRQALEDGGQHGPPARVTCKCRRRPLGTRGLPSPAGCPAPSVPPGLMPIPASPPLPSSDFSLPEGSLTLPATLSRVPRPLHRPCLIWHKEGTCRGDPHCTSNPRWQQNPSRAAR